MKTEKITRRKLLGASLLGLPAIPVVVETAFAADAAKALPELKADEPAAKALGYNADSTKVDEKANPMHKAGQQCSNCLQWAEKTAVPLGKCNLFPGKLVKSGGWCKVYVKKA
ncbi:MAG: high-potential iron-sulfur protein [Steroidobacteraceae bacterium]